jgi:WXG100 family type VII secretion target
MILYTPTELQGKSRQIQNCKEEIIQIINAIDNEINSLKPEWQGLAKDGFVMNYENSKPTINSYIECINEIANEINSAVLQSQQADSECASIIGRW